MWPDHETDLDLLGLDYLIDELIVALTEPRLLPLTVGVLGDWGSGKSSMLALTRRELERQDAADSEQPRHLFVPFSPWQHEDYDDVKTALMSAVLATIQDAAPKEHEEDVGRLKRIISGMRRRSRTVGRAGVFMLPAVGAATLAAIDPGAAAVTTDLVKAGSTAVAAEAGRLLAEPGADDAADDAVTDPAGFRRLFESLLAKIDDVAAVVVLIDDLDRCLPGTVVDTFEAMRLFLNTPKTAWVIAAHEAVVESAIDSLYPDLKRPDGSGIGADYVEKMIQLRVALPALSSPEAQTYMNLLLAELHLGRDSDAFTKVMTLTRNNRSASNLTVAFNLEVAGEALGVDNVPEGLARDLDWAGTVGAAVAAGLEGNPRRIKRFLNTLSLRQRAAARRKIDLRQDVLAKLTLLEQRHLPDFQRLYDWQVATPGPPPELATAESLANTAEGDRTKDGTIPETVTTWVSHAHVAEWLQSPPMLGGLDLRPYFTYARDKLSPGAAETLSPAVQALLGRLLETKGRARHSVADQIAALSPEQRAQLVRALLTLASRSPDSEAFSAAAEVAARAEDSVDVTVEMYSRLPHTAVPIARVAPVIAALPADNPRVQALIAGWAASSTKKLATVAAKIGGRTKGSGT